MSDQVKRFFGHLRTINHHKLLVTVNCLRAGLIRQGIAHDLSKYTPVEFISGVRYYQGGKRSPINYEKEVKGYSYGWLHHKARNRHHFEYWIDYAPNPAGGLIGVKMPKRYVAEMCIDRICASRNYQKEKYTDRSALDYYLAGKAHCVIHPESAFLLEYLLRMTAAKGERYTYRYIRRRLMKNPGGDYHVRNGKLILD